MGIIIAVATRAANDAGCGNPASSPFRRPQEYDQTFYPRVVVVLILAMAVLVGLGTLCVVHIGKPIQVSAS